MDFAAFSREIHRAARKPRVRRPVIVSGIDATWGLDLADFQEWAPQNNGFKYALCVVDVFSRYAWVRPLRTKTAAECWAALNDIMTSSGRSPRKLWADEGGEFVNKTWRAHLAKAGIDLYHTHGEHKSALAERFIRTLKTSVWRKFTELQSRAWVPLVTALVAAYNGRVHSALRMSPADASKPANEAALWAYQYGDVASPPVVPTAFHVGDWVRISRIKGRFEKGFHPAWSWEVYRVTGVDAHAPPTYTLADYFGEPVTGSFYEAELQRTKDKDFMAIEKVVRTRTVKGVKQLLVQWLGYGPKRQTWIDASSITNVL